MSYKYKTLKEQGVIMKLKAALIMLLVIVFIAGCGSPAAVKINSDNIKQLQSRTDTLGKEIHNMSSLVNEMMIQVSIMNSHIDKMSNINLGDDVVVDDEMRFIEQEISRLSTRLSDMEAVSTPGAVDVSRGKGPMTVKVLTGSGDIRGAKLLANTLRSSGYNVAVVDYSASDIHQNTVFYATGYRNEALNLSRIMGRDTIVKPLTWNSIFKLIVVKGS
jgi:outer membrane murein-binding lipoprotein Lpp